MTSRGEAAAHARASIWSLSAAALSAVVLAGCAFDGGSMRGGPARAPAPAGITRDAFVGKWGIASYHDVKDRKRTETQAKDQCKQPYVITLGPNDGVMMHVADDPKLYELRLKAAADGRNYIGFESPAGDPGDREIISISPDLIEMRFVDPDAHRRYGTFIFSRCR